MSNVNIKRAVENIRSNTNVYTPLVEVIVNGIEAIETKEIKNGEVQIIVERQKQAELEGTLSAVESFEVIDNGIGFTDANRASFDTLYSDYKIKVGGKGFGRFLCLKYFKDLIVDSVFFDGSEFKMRTFMMGKNNEIIVNERVVSSQSKETRSKIRLDSVRNGKFIDKKLSIIAKNIVEKILPYFITQDYDCPKICISEKDNSECIVLNDYLNNELSDSIKEIKVTKNVFTLHGNSSEEDFLVRIFKFYSPKSQKSKISLVAHKREVTDTTIHNYIPEFIDEFYEKSSDENNKERNYIIKTYVFSDYLDNNVSLERVGFEFKKENDLTFGISQNEIEKAAAAITMEAVGYDITLRQEKKRDCVRSYVDEHAPWHREILENIDLSNMPYNPSNEEIESKLQNEKFKQEVAIKKQVKQLLSDGSIESMKDNVTEIVKKISGNSKNDLAHYIAFRRNVLDIFKKSLELDPQGKYSSEGVIHDIIFPRKKDTETIPFSDHNLWIIDERLNFTNYISSDLPLNEPKSGRPDLLVYDRRVVFRGDNESSNPVTIFEFKKPQRDEFVNPSVDEDPVQQIIRYVNNIREGKYKTPQGRKILVSENTPFYGYVICDLTDKVEKWLEKEKDFKPMPDRLGWFQWRGNINLYIEVLSWDKLLRDANMRNNIFFHKLGI
ncbi:ATPase [Candidatus Peregrinibacteria bacterium RIFOXYA2_FULL_33_7]|nr:MAG: ATPase [Candidatus Peregrinibacteria bacterium RIFOXYA2_FULL_33_7]